MGIFLVIWGTTIVFFYINMFLDALISNAWYRLLVFAFGVAILITMYVKQRIKIEELEERIEKLTGDCMK